MNKLTQSYYESRNLHQEKQEKPRVKPSHKTTVVYLRYVQSV